MGSGLVLQVHYPLQRVRSRQSDRHLDAGRDRLPARDCRSSVGDVKGPCLGWRQSGASKPITSRSRLNYITALIIYAQHEPGYYYVRSFADGVSLWVATSCVSDSIRCKTIKNGGLTGMEHHSHSHAAGRMHDRGIRSEELILPRINAFWENGWAMPRWVPAVVKSRTRADRTAAPRVLRSSQTAVLLATSRSQNIRLHFAVRTPATGARNSKRGR